VRLCERLQGHKAIGDKNEGGVSGRAIIQIGEHAQRGFHRRAMVSARHHTGGTGIEGCFTVQVAIAPFSGQGDEKRTVPHFAGVDCDEINAGTRIADKKATRD